MTFPSWTAAEIHAAINESKLSPETTAALRRVGGLMAERDGGGPDLFLRLEREESRAEGMAEGVMEGVRKAFEFMAVLESRGFARSTALMGSIRLISRIDEAELMRLAMNCRDESDLPERLDAAVSSAG